MDYAGGQKINHANSSADKLHSSELRSEERVGREGININAMFMNAGHLSFDFGTVNDKLR